MSYAMPGTDPTNVVGRRIGAALVDLIIAGIVVFAVVVPAFNSKAITAPSGTVQCASSGGDVLTDSGTRNDSKVQICFDDGDQVHYLPPDEADGFIRLLYGTLFGVLALDLVLLQGLVGASIGKLLVGLRVVRPDGDRAGLGWAALRWVLFVVDGLLCCLLPGIILVFATRGHRRLGDMVASTYVVDKGQVGTPVVLPGDVPVGGYGPGPYGSGTGPTGAPTAGGWGPAPSGPATPWAPPGGAGGAAPSADGPTWDPARDAYIQYDRDRAAWLQWNEGAQEWRPIDQ